MKVAFQAVFDILWSSADSVLSREVPKSEVRSGIVHFDWIEFETGLSEQVIEGILDRLASIGSLKLMYVKPKDGDGFVSYQAFSDLAPLPGHIPIYRQRARWVEAATNPATEETKSGYVYLIEGKKGIYKIGRTVDPDTRIKTLHVALPFPIKPIHIIKCRDYFAAENELHRKYWPKRIRGEWYKLAADDVAAIKSITTM